MELRLEVRTRVDVSRDQQEIQVISVRSAGVPFKVIQSPDASCYSGLAQQLCAKVVSNSDFRRKLTTSGSWEKTKTCFNIESILGKEIPSDCFVTNILCRNCTDKNETHVRKLHSSPRDSQILFSLSDLKYPLAVPPSNRLLRTML